MHLQAIAQRRAIRASPSWVAERSPRSSVPTRCGRTGFSTTWSGAIRSPTPRWCRCCTYTSKWRLGARKTHRHRIWWWCSPTTRNPGFKPSRTPHPTFHRYQENTQQSGATTSTSDTEHFPFWRASTIDLLSGEVRGLVLMTAGRGAIWAERSGPARQWRVAAMAPPADARRHTADRSSRYEFFEAWADLSIRSALCFDVSIGRLTFVAASKKITMLSQAPRCGMDRGRLPQGNQPQFRHQSGFIA
jgi:hypothetical protein